jgi:hypothetical protein
LPVPAFVIVHVSSTLSGKKGSVHGERVIVLTLYPVGPRFDGLFIRD